MINKDQKIPCQLCNTPVPFDMDQFIKGYSFACPNPDCDARYSMPVDTRGVVRSAMVKYEQLKKNKESK